MAKDNKDKKDKKKKGKGLSIVKWILLAPFILIIGGFFVGLGAYSFLPSNLKYIMDGNKKVASTEAETETESHEGYLVLETKKGKKFSMSDSTNTAKNVVSNKNLNKNKVIGSDSKTNSSSKNTNSNKKTDNNLNSSTENIGNNSSVQEQPNKNSINTPNSNSVANSNNSGKSDISNSGSKSDIKSNSTTNNTANTTTNNLNNSTSKNGIEQLASVKEKVNPTHNANTKPKIDFSGDRNTIISNSKKEDISINVRYYESLGSYMYLVFAKNNTKSIVNVKSTVTLKQNGGKMDVIPVSFEGLEPNQTYVSTYLTKTTCDDFEADTKCQKASNTLIPGLDNVKYKTKQNKHNIMVQFSNEGDTSCSYEGCVVFWKNGKVIDVTIEGASENIAPLTSKAKKTHTFETNEKFDSYDLYVIAYHNKKYD